MKRSFFLFVLGLFALGASAGTITSIDPSMVKVNSGEHFLTIYGTGLGNVVVFDGPAGHYEVNTNASFTGQVVAWVPSNVIRFSGYYSVFVRGGTGDSNSVTFEVRGFKFFPFVILVPEVLRIQPDNREGAYVKYDVFGAGGEESVSEIRCFPESGSFFKMGETTVDCEGMNGKETAKANFTVLVRDELPPTVYVPREPIVVKAESREGTLVEFDAKAYDDLYGDLLTECTPKSGSIFPVGVTNVQCSATDPDGNIGFGVFDVEVVGDVKWYPLTVHVPETIVADARSIEGEYVEFKVTVSGGDDPEPELTCSHESGALYPIGTTVVVCDAIDRWGMRGRGNFAIEVRDPNAPIIEKLYATPDVLKADGAIWRVEVTAYAIDEIDRAPVCSIFSVTSNQQIHLGDFEDPEKYYDWKITGDLSVELRGEAVRVDRYYDVWVGCQDFYGNRTNATTRVVVPAGSGQSAPAPASPKRRSGGKS